MRIALLLALTLLVATPVLAAEKDGKDKDAADGQYVKVSPVAAPIVLNGRLINYIFVTLRVNLAPNIDALRMREREPYYRDAFVRVAHRTPFIKPGDYTHVNEPMLKAAMMAQAVRIAGPGVVTGIDILSAQPQKITGLPRPEAAPAAPRAPIP